MQENEIITLVLGLGALIFTYLRRKELENMPGWGVALAAILSLVGAWIFTVAEGVFWGPQLNILEHFCYAASSVLFATWCWMQKRAESRPTG